MDRLEQTLRDDAAEIQAKVSPEISDRIMARVQDTRQKREPETREQSPLRWWWASSLTGLAAAVTLLAVINWDVDAPAPTVQDLSVVQTVPRPANIFDNRVPLKLQQANLTNPLEEELQNLESDLEKARDVVRNDLRLDF